MRIKARREKGAAGSLERNEIRRESAVAKSKTKQNNTEKGIKKKGVG